ncbi:hypothetical protein AcV5_000350 [Taiwanofungus camphoratus]|nr:hypothetical protein AcV5_000350 [Antrodia cinnamomea]
MSYVIFGRAIKNEYLALGTILGAVGLGLLSTGGKKEAPAGSGKQTTEQVKDTPKFNASSSEEEELYVYTIFSVIRNGLSTTDQGEQHQEICRGRGEGVKTLALWHRSIWHLLWLVIEIGCSEVHLLPLAMTSAIYPRSQERSLPIEVFTVRLPCMRPVNNFNCSAQVHIRVPARSIIVRRQV